jgi:hypothetical protein
MYLKIIKYLELSVDKRVMLLDALVGGKLKRVHDILYAILGKKKYPILANLFLNVRWYLFIEDKIPEEVKVFVENGQYKDALEYIEEEQLKDNNDYIATISNIYSMVLELKISK